MKSSEQTRNDLLEAGVLIDQYGLLKPDLKNLDAVKQKILPNLLEVKSHTDALRAKGKHILYMPGSYDLVHAGHASYILQGITWYLSLEQHAALTRSDVSVLVLVDDDHLIASAKRTKWVGAGGEETFKRPLQSENVMGFESGGANWRLVEVASLPYVDIVGFIPSPVNGAYLAVADVVSLQQHPDTLQLLLEDFKSNKKVTEKEEESLQGALIKYADLSKTMLADYRAVVSEFEESTSDLSLMAWQLFIHTYLGFGTFSTPFVRVISHADAKIKNKVNFVMQGAGLHALYFDDVHLMSTTSILREHGLEVLLGAKVKNYLQA